MVSQATRQSEILQRLLFSITLAGMILAFHGTHLRAAPVPDPLHDLIRSLRDKDETIRAKAAADLEKRGREAVSAVPQLLRALEDHHPKVRDAAVRALIRIHGKEALPAVVKALRSEEDPDVRFLLVTIVLQWGRDRGPEVKEIIPALIETMKLDYEEYGKAVESSWIALQVIGTKAVPALVALAMDSDQELIKRTSAIHVLERMGAEGKKAVPALIELSRDLDDDLASEAVYALGKLGDGDKGAIRALEAYGERVHSVHGFLEAAGALARIDPANKHIVPFILKVLKEGGSFERASGAVIAGRIGPRARGAIPALAELFKDPEDYTRAEAIRAMAAVALEDKAVRALILKASRDPSSVVREEAKRAMKQIQYKHNKD